MPEPVAVTKQVVEIQIPKELLGTRLFLYVDKKDLPVTIVDNAQSDHVVAVVYPGGTHAVVTSQNFFAVANGDSKLTISPG